MFDIKKETIFSIKNPTDIEIDKAISRNCRVEGNLVSKKSVKIDAEVVGNINVKNGVIIGESALITGPFINKQLCLLIKMGNSITLRLKTNLLMKL